MATCSAQLEHILPKRVFPKIQVNWSAVHSLEELLSPTPVAPHYPRASTTSEVGGPLIMVFSIAADSWLSPFHVIAPQGKLPPLLPQRELVFTYNIKLLFSGGTLTCDCKAILSHHVHV